MRDSVKILIILSVSFLLLEVETRLQGYIPISGLLAIMSMGWVGIMSARVVDRLGKGIRTAPRDVNMI